jgi:hypothetical protein
MHSDRNGWRERKPGAIHRGKKNRESALLLRRPFHREDRPPVQNKLIDAEEKVKMVRQEDIGTEVNGVETLSASEDAQNDVVELGTCSPMATRKDSSNDSRTGPAPTAPPPFSPAIPFEPRKFASHNGFGLQRAVRHPLEAECYAAPSSALRLSSARVNRSSSSAMFL